MTQPLVERLHLIRNDPEFGACAAFLVIDATWQEELAEEIRREAEGWDSLMATPQFAKEKTHLKSPLLIDIGVHPQALEQWLLDGFQQKLGFVIFSHKHLPELRRSLKRFFMVLLANGEKPTIFRFFDARVLYCFLRHGYPSQWKDFFRDIEWILAPSDLSLGWTHYRFNCGSLEIGLDQEFPSTAIDWATYDNRDREVVCYEISFPYRHIDHRQYDDMTLCCEQFFLYEIADFIRQAFPEESQEWQQDALIKLLADSHSLARRQGFDEENCLYYWGVLSFMGGQDFYCREAVAKVLANNLISPATRLETLLFNAGTILDNQKLMDLADVIECKLHFTSGKSIHFKERSGKVLGVSHAS